MENINTTCRHHQCSKRIFVQSVPVSMTKNDLDQFFSKFGKLQFSKVMCDYKTKIPRSAVIKYVNLNDAQKLLQLPESELISVMKPKPSRCRYTEKGAEGSLRRKYVQVKYDKCDQDEFEAEDCYFNRLPDELIKHIFSFLYFKERIFLESVCKRWRHINTTVAWKNLQELNFDNVRVKVLSDQILMEILKRCGSTLRKIDFSSCCDNTLTKEFPIKLANYCPNLQTVDFLGNAIEVKTMKIFSEQCKNLKSVSLKKCDLVEESIEFLLKNSNLHHLDLSGNREITGECFNFIKDFMKTLILNGCAKLSPKGFKLLETKVGICDLRLNNCNLLTPESLISVISSLEGSLIELHLGGNFELCNESDYEELFLRCKNLKRLNLENNCHITNNIVSVISKNCPLLCSLNLNATPINDGFLISLKKLSNLRDLSISSEARITDGNRLNNYRTTSIVEKLERFELYLMDGDSDCLFLIINCNRLKFLDFSSCSYLINRVVLEALLLKRSRNTGNTGITTEENTLCVKIKLCSDDISHFYLAMVMFSKNDCEYWATMGLPWVWHDLPWYAL